MSKLYLTYLYQTLVGPLPSSSYRAKPRTQRISKMMSNRMSKATESGRKFSPDLYQPPPWLWGGQRRDLLPKQGNDKTVVAELSAKGERLLLMLVVRNHVLTF